MVAPRTSCILALLVTGCIGSIESLPGDSFDDPAVAEACRTRSLPVQPLRRLSSRQYANVMRELFGPALADPLLAGTLFPKTVITQGFTNDAAANTVNTSQSNAIEDEAQRIASTILANPTAWKTALVPCADVDSCIDPFIADFGRRAYRRPLTTEEAALVRRIYDAVRTTQPATNAWASVVQFFVQSPALLYRIEHGGAPGPVEGLLELTPYEMANRLSFLFLDGGPDDELYAAAERGELATKEQIAAHARRLIASPRFAQVLSDFHADWLHLHELTNKDPSFTAYTPAVQASLAREVGELTRMVFESGGTIGDVLGTTQLPVDATLAAFYGVTAPASGWAPMEIPGRAGILTLGSVQAALAGSNATSPIHRGNFFRTEVLCKPTIVFPAGLDTSTPLENASTLPTARQRLAPLTSNPTCAGCHTQINPIGLAFENFDAIGRWRDQENGVAIDASGSIELGTTEEPNLLAFANAGELATAIAPMPEVQSCYALHWFRASTGRSETDEDGCSTSQLDHLVTKSGGDLRELMVALTQIDAFRFRRIQEEN